MIIVTIKRKHNNHNNSNNDNNNAPERHGGVPRSVAEARQDLA